MVEIVEYLVTLTVVNNGVGGYDNNTQDMIANLAGSICCVVVLRIRDMVRDKMNVNSPLADARAPVVER